MANKRTRDQEQWDDERARADALPKGVLCTVCVSEAVKDVGDVCDNCVIPKRSTRIRLTTREIEASLEALQRCLAGEPETDDEDVEGMVLAVITLKGMLVRRRRKK